LRKKVVEKLARISRTKRSGPLGDWEWQLAIAIQPATALPCSLMWRETAKTNPKAGTENRGGSRRNTSFCRRFALMSTDFKSKARAQRETMERFFGQSIQRTFISRSRLVDFDRHPHNEEVSWKL
jgi:hypothetical protein